LTNGLGHLYTREELDLARFVRIQSSHLEAKAFHKVLYGIGHDLPLQLALGNDCVVLDKCHNRHRDNYSRALWQGIPWITYVLERAWGLKHSWQECRGHACKAFFAEMLRKKACYEPFEQLKYFRKFLNTETVNLYMRTGLTGCDGDYQYWRDHLISLNRGLNELKTTQKKTTIT
jgi:hypothetical protein